MIELGMYLTKHVTAPLLVAASLLYLIAILFGERVRK